MDQKQDILEISLLDQVPHFIKSNEKKKVARRRWAILAKALKSPTASQPSSPTDEISVRRISSFMLLSTHELPLPPKTTPQTAKRTWFEYSLHLHGAKFTLNVGHRNRTFSAEDLMGFNNTGNVCIWPSEETLSHYVCENLSLFEGKRVLELGGGMSCLAGLFAAKYGGASEVVVTDGNKTSIDNVEAIIECNCFPSPTTAAILQWNNLQHHQKIQFDCILSADCLFFDDARLDFINCLKSHLKSDGRALVMAPERGETLDSFILQSEAWGLCCRKIVNYSPVVWEKRLALMDNVDFDDNIHYPILIEVTKV